MMHQWLHRPPELTKLVLSRIVKSDVLKQAKDVMKVDLSKLCTMLSHTTKVNVGFIAERAGTFQTA